MNIKGVIFDVDGTLLDTMHVWTDSGATYLASLGIEAEPNLGDKLFAMTVQMGAVYLKERYGLSQSVDEIRRGINGVVENYYFEEADFKPGARELLEELKAAGVPMAIATSTERYCILAAFDRLGYTDYFDTILTCGEVGASKSEPVIFYEAMRVLGTSPAETWLFEDGLYSIKTAGAAGLRTVGVYDAVSEKDQEEIRRRSDIYVRDLRDFSLGRHTTLTIAGSDCSGGAGIQADIKTMLANGVYAMSAITALTAQNTKGISGIMDVTPDFLAKQIDAVFTDIRPDAVKIGMVSSPALIETIGERLRFYHASNIVVDPVMVSTSGAKLLADHAAETLCRELLPMAAVVTPNIPEAAVLAKIDICDAADMETAAKIIWQRYGCCVLVKGGHQVHDADDLLYDGRELRWFRGARIDNKNTHGTGCTLSSAIAARLAKGYSLAEAINGAKEYISEALSAMLDLGEGSGPLDHGFGIR